MVKAYDRLEWDFIFAVLARFHSSWINYIRVMFTECWFSILMNGQVHGFFQSSRGLRQGDPLATSLFLLAEEVLSRGLCKLYQEGAVMPYRVPRRCQPISHLLFADDTIIFCNGSKRSLKNRMTFLQSYEQASGQLVSRDKSCFITSSKG